MSNLVKALLVCGASIVVATGVIVGFAEPTNAITEQTESTKTTVVCEEVIDENAESDGEEYDLCD